MSSPPPTKPPRGVKQGKETSGLLMSVIRTLSASETNEQREKERAKLEKEYKKSDARLDELVAAHAQEITDVMQKFSQVSAALTAWGSAGAAGAGRLAACRGLLRLRRADLRRLWTDARTHHYALQMLTDIERVVVSERETREALQAGRVLAAAHTLSAALAVANNTLSHVSALNTTRQHLEAKKRELVEVIVRRLSGAVYQTERALLPRRVSARRRPALLLAELMKTGEVTEAYLEDVTPELEAALTEEDITFDTTASIALEALGVLDQLKEATEKFKVQIQNELLEVIDCVSRRVIEEGDVDLEGEEDVAIPEGEGVTESGRPLARLIACLSDEFDSCAARNRRLLQLWRAALQRHGYADACLHTEQHYWSAVQQVLQLLLTEYLDIESVNLAAARSAHAHAQAGAAPGTAPAAADGSELRLSDYFAKKRAPRRRTKLFKLAAPETSSPAATGRGGGRRPNRPARPLVCRPAPAHLHAALPGLHALCARIEPHASGAGGECSLRAFISDYVRAGESERLASAARRDIEATMRAPHAWRERATPPTHTTHHASHAKGASGASAGAGPGGAGGAAAAGHAVVFACCVGSWAGVQAAAAAARRCGTCGGQEALVAVRGALAVLATQCRAGHSKLVPPSSPTRAVKWLADDDIVRFLQSLPNWRAATTASAASPASPAEIKPQELTQAYEREAEILGSSLGDGAVTRREIIADVNALANIAVLCESMDWLSCNIKALPSFLSAPSPGIAGGGLKLTDKFVGDLHAAASIFDEISHKCLLLLHLEVRIQCFHYLGQEEGEGGEDGAGGAGSGAGGASQLAKALLAFHEQASAVLSRQRLQYVIGGVGEMMSAAVVWRWQERGQGAGGGGGADSHTARLAALRHCLAALQLPHSGLHRAHDYLHMLNCTPEEIIQSVREKGPQFSELEYLNAFKLIGARRRLPPHDMRAHLKHLSVALGHRGVTV